MTVKEKLEQAGSKILNWIGKTKNGKSGRFVPCHEVDIDSFIKNNLNGKAITLYLYIIKELSKDYLDFAHFTISGLAEKLNTSNKTIRQSLEDCVNSGLIFTFDLGNKGKLIFLSKESNLSIIEGIEKGVFKVENYIEQKVKIDNMLVRSCTSYWEVNDLATRKQMTQQLEPNSNSYWEVNDLAVQSESIEKTTNTSTSLEPIQEPLLRTSSLEEEASNQNLKTSSENLKQPLPKNDDDFLKNFDKEEEEKVNPIIEVLEEKISDKVDPSKSNKYETDKPDLTHTKKVSGVAGANCGQNVERFKTIIDLALSVKYSINNELKSFQIDKPTLERKLKETYSTNFDKMEEIVKTQVEAFRFRDNLPLEKLGGVFVNCLKENRALPDSYFKYIQEQKDLQDEIEYLPILEAWQGHPASKKNIKNTLMALLSRDICSLKDQEKNPSYNQTKLSFKEKVKKISQFCDFSKLIESFNQSAKDRCFMILNEVV